MEVLTLIVSAESLTKHQRPAAHGDSTLFLIMYGVGTELLIDKKGVRAYGKCDVVWCGVVWCGVVVLVGCGLWLKDLNSEEYKVP